jgi:hypothetical protein
MISAVRIAGVACVMLGLAGCAAPPPEGPPTADQAARAACRQQAEQSYDIRNRADRYKPEYGRDSPLSGQSSPEISRGLVDRYSYEQSYLDCLRSRGARQTPPTAPAQAGQPPVPPRSSVPAPPSPAPVSGAPASRPPSSSSDLSRPPALTP